MSEDPDTDNLIEQYEQGVSGARSRLLLRHRERLKRMVKARMDPRLSRRFDPSDVIQETLVQAANELPEYVSKRPLPFYPWLRQIAWNRLVDEHRKHLLAQRRSLKKEDYLDSKLPDASVAYLAERLVGAGTTPSKDAVRREMIQRVREAVDALKPEDRELIVLRHVERLSIRDTAAVLGISEGATKTRHVRIVQRLHQHLTEDEFGIG